MNEGDTMDMIEAGTALAVIQRSEVSTIIAADENDILGKLREELKAYTPDGSTPEGREEIGSKARKVGTAKQALIRLADALKEDAQKTIKGVNAEVKIIETKMDTMRDSILAPRVAYQEREKSRVAAHEAVLAAITAASTMEGEPSLRDIDDALESIEVMGQRDWQEFADRADHAANAACAKLLLLRGQTERRIAEAAELARLRAETAERDRLEASRLQAEREARIAAEAAEAARLETERKAAAEAAEAERRAAAERERIAAEAQRALDAVETERVRIELEAREAKGRAQKAEADRIAAEAKAKADAEALARRVDADRIAAAQKADRDRAAAVAAEQKRVADAKAAADAEAARRAADKAHRARINSTALAALVTAGLPEEHGRVAIEAIARGRVPAVSISY